MVDFTRPGSMLSAWVGGPGFLVHEGFVDGAESVQVHGPGDGVAGVDLREV